MFQAELKYLFIKHETVVRPTDQYSFIHRVYLLHWIVLRTHVCSGYDANTCIY